MGRTGHFLGRSYSVPSLWDGGEPWNWVFSGVRVVESMAMASWDNSNLKFCLWKALMNILPTGISWCSSCLIFSFVFSAISLNRELLWSSLSGVHKTLAVLEVGSARVEWWSLTPLSWCPDIFSTVKQRAVTHSSTERLGGGSPTAVK